MKIIKIISLLALIGSLAACNSDDGGFDEIAIDAELDQGTQWQESLVLGSFPSALENPQHGDLILNSDSLRYVPEPSFRGRDTALVEGRSAVYRLTFTVKPVNQPPQLLDTEIKVIAHREIEGQLHAYDQDDDPVTFELIEAPAEGTFSLNESSGLFHFLQDDLVLPNATFVVALHDGVNDAVIETVEMLPAYSTNEEKAAYYYHSKHSHLLQAEQRIKALNSDVDTADGYTQIAVGYALASMDAEVDRTLTQGVTGQSEQAYALRALAETYQSLGMAEKAAVKRRAALQAHAQMMLDNGIENMTGSDGSYYLTLQNHALDAGDDELVGKISQQLRVYIDVLGASGELKKAMNYMANALRGAALDNMELYAETGNPDDLQNALSNTDDYAYLVSKTGYQLNKDGQRRYQSASLFSGWAAELYYNLGAIEDAKRQLAYTLSFYGDVHYDPDYSFSARPYADITLEDYPTGAANVAGYFSLLYPQATENQALVFIQDTGRPYERALDKVARAEFMQRAIQGEAISTVVADLMDHYASSGTREQFSQLTLVNITEPGLAPLLLRLGFKQEAEEVLLFAATHLISGAYIAENSRAPQFMTGTSGCYRLLKATLQLGNTELARQRAGLCEDLLASTTDQYWANIKNVIAIYLDVDLPERATDLAVKAEYELQSEEDELIRAQGWADLANLLMHAKSYEKGLEYAQLALQDLRSLPVEEPADVKPLLTTLNKLSDPIKTSGVLMPARSALTELRSHAYNHPDYQSWVTKLANDIGAEVNRIAQAIKELPGPEHEALSEGIVESLAFIRNYAGAEALISELSLGAAERLKLRAQISAIQAVQDDFPASIVATVDTDMDGRANFFAVAATQEQLAETDIELDDDADGDGVKDEEDPLPLG